MSVKHGKSVAPERREPAEEPVETVDRRPRGKPRKEHNHLPWRMVVNRNTYYFLKPLPGSRTKSINLGKVQEDGKTLTECLEAALKKYKEVFEASPEDVSVAWLLNEWKIKKLPSYSAQRQKIYRGYLEKISSQLGKLKVSQVRPVHVAKFIDLNFEHMPHTANAYKTLFANVFNLAIRLGIRDTNPTQDIEPLPEPKRKRYITDQELVWILSCAAPMVRVLIQLGALTGQRISDLLSLQWSDVTDKTLYLEIADLPEEYDIANDEIEIEGEDELKALAAKRPSGHVHGRLKDVPGVLFHPSKTRKTTGKRVAIEMSDQLRDAFKQARAIGGKPSRYVIHKPDGDPYTYSGARGAWLRAIAKARRSYYYECAKQGYKPNPRWFLNVHFHDLKRKALTDANNQGLDAQKLGAHASRKMTEHYLEDVEGAPHDWIKPPKMPF